MQYDYLSFLFQYVFVEVSAGLLMSNSGSDGPTAVAKLNSIGAISRAENKKSAAALTSAISQNLGIQPNRYDINLFIVCKTLLFNFNAINIC